MIIYADTEKELTFDDYKPLPPLRGVSLADLRELENNLENALENTWIYGAWLLQCAIDQDMRKVELYIKIAEKRENK